MGYSEEYSYIASRSNRSVLDDLDCPSAGSESIASTELQEVEDTVVRLLCELQDELSNKTDREIESFRYLL